MNADPVLSLLKELVAIDSVNPTLVPGAAGEGRIADAIARRMRGLGLDVQLQEAAPGRPNVIGVLEGTESGPSLMLCGHTDTVGVEGMTAPFDPVERDGRIYGRGAQDMKGGVAAMIDAARVARARGFRKGRLIVAAVADEEYASLGADALVRAWHADMAVVTEPTDLQIAAGHMPVSENLPYQWFNTPNVHLCTIADFEDFCASRGIRVVERKVLTRGRPVTLWPNFFGALAVFHFGNGA